MQGNSPEQLRSAIKIVYECSKLGKCCLLKLLGKAVMGAGPQRMIRPQMGVFTLFYAVRRHSGI